MATRSKSPAKSADRPPCLCGCGGFPAGRRSRYRPGHDAKHLSALKKAKLEKAANRKTARVAKSAPEQSPTEAAA